jgi:hypothetical protein
MSTYHLKMTRFVRARLHAWRQGRAQRELLRRYTGFADEILPSDWAQSLSDPTRFYERCFQYFHTRLPDSLRKHRTYFESNGRGFGEKSFHVMWFLLFREFSLESFLEIGVYRGQTLSLAALLSRYFGYSCFVQGISPFSSAGDSVSEYLERDDYYSDTFKNFAHFSLPVPKLLKALSTDDAAVELIASREWSCIYIDGNHDYATVRQDWNLCSAHLRSGGLIVLDDAGLTTKYSPPIFATGGHPGPSQLAQEIDQSRFREILQVGHNRVFQKIAD